MAAKEKLSESFPGKFLDTYFLVTFIVVAEDSN